MPTTIITDTCGDTLEVDHGLGSVFLEAEEDLIELEVAGAKQLRDVLDTFLQEEEDGEGGESYFVDALLNEDVREYAWFDPATGNLTTYTIYNPQRLVVPSAGSTTHRVVDSAGIVHIVPAVGQLGCAVRVSGPVLF